VTVHTTMLAWAPRVISPRPAIRRHTCIFSSSRPRKGSRRPRMIRTAFEKFPCRRVTASTTRPNLNHGESRSCPPPAWPARFLRHHISLCATVPMSERSKDAVVIAITLGRLHSTSSAATSPHQPRCARSPIHPAPPTRHSRRGPSSAARCGLCPTKGARADRERSSHLRRLAAAFQVGDQRPDIRDRL